MRRLAPTAARITCRKATVSLKNTTSGRCFSASWTSITFASVGSAGQLVTIVDAIDSTASGPVQVGHKVRLLLTGGVLAARPLKYKQDYQRTVVVVSYSQARPSCEVVIASMNAGSFWAKINL